MLLSDIQPYPTLRPERLEEVTDGELLRITVADPRAEIGRLLQIKRAPPVYHQLQRIMAVIDGQIRETSAASLESHLARKNVLQYWHNLDALAKTQANWHLQQVVVNREEVAALVTRWLLLLFDQASEKTREIAGRKVVAGIILPTAGGRHG